MDYTQLSLREVGAELGIIARDVDAAFGTLDARQLNWKPDTTRWSVGQCFEHLFTANRLMFDAAVAALDPSRTRTIWQRLPVVPGLLGRMMVRSQAPGGRRKFSAPPAARPAESDVAADIVDRFVDQQRGGANAVSTLRDRDAVRTIMVSPFVRVITYSVLDGWRLIVAHDHRHIEQARRVMSAPGFPTRR